MFSIETTSTTTPFTIDNWSQLLTTPGDNVTRTIVDSSTKSVSTTSWPTSELNKQIEWYLQHRTNSDIEVLKKYAKWQRKYIDYQATYAALLLGAISEDDFEREAEKNSPDIRDLPIDALVPEITQLTELLDFDLRTQELADYFETEPNIINEALKRAYNYLQVKHEDSKLPEALTDKYD
jgi:hypothetical protein